MIDKELHKQRSSYNALVALGFKCSCGAIKARELHIVNKQGKLAHRKLARLLGDDLLSAIAREPAIRSQYLILCTACRSNHDNMLASSITYAS